MMRSPRIGIRERGSVLILALLVTLVILGIGITAMWVSTSGMKVSSNITRRQEALYATEVGIERARALLTSTADWSTLLKGTACTPAETPFDDKKGRILCKAADRLSDVQVVSGFSGGGDPISAKMRYTVYIRNDWDVECDDKNSKAKGIDCGSGKSGGKGGTYDTLNTDTNGRVIVRAEGIGRDGLSYVAIEAVLSRQ